MRRPVALPAASQSGVRDAACVNLSEIASLVAADAPGADIAINDLVYDSKDVSVGSLFVCIKGVRDDGHRYVADAEQRGAAAILCEHPVPSSLPQIMVANARDAMNLLAGPFFGNPSNELPIVAVTGTNGKTTTTFMIESAISQSAPSGLIGTVEVRVAGESFPGIRTTPESVDLQRLFRKMIDSSVRTCAMEVTSEGIVAGRIEGTRFVLAAFTNLTQDHLDSHGSMENYFAAKRQLFDPVHTDLALVNIDDPWGARLASELSIEVLTYAIQADADLRAVDVDLHAHHSTFNLVGRGPFKGIAAPLITPIPGRFNVYNALAAVGALHLLGFDAATISRGISSLKGVPGRFESIDLGQEFGVIVDYAHTPDSLANVLTTAREMAAGRVLAVFGCGGDRDSTKRPLMGKVANDLADLAIITSDNPRSEDPLAIIEQVVAGIVGTAPAFEYDVVPGRAEAIAHAVREARKGDVLIIAGKGHEIGQEFKDQKIPFDDREVARRFVRERIEAER